MQYEVMTFLFPAPEPKPGQSDAVKLPDGWTPLSAVRQGETVLVLCSQPVAELP
jgi:hypothetical protein